MLRSSNITMRTSSRQKREKEGNKLLELTDPLVDYQLSDYRDLLDDTKNRIQQ
jgi:hypothetical protein